MVSAPTADPAALGNAGIIYVFLGLPDGEIVTVDELNGTNGFRLIGTEASTELGRWLVGLGDVNGDGFDDVAFSIRNRGVHVVLGRSGGFPATSLVTGAEVANYDGFRIFTTHMATEHFLKGLGCAGDVNGDGLQDIIVGSHYSASDGRLNTGMSFVVYGSSVGFSPDIKAEELNGKDGARFEGIGDGDYLGSSVASAGDFNGDGFDDVIIGAMLADPNGKTDAGEAYVVFGSASGFPQPFDLSLLDGTDGFRIAGANVGDQLGLSVGGRGDVNGDGYDDVIVGSRLGEDYLIYGAKDGLPAQQAVTELDGTNGYKIVDTASGHVTGGISDSATLGDVNGDGFDDIFVGGYGDGYVIFGAPSGGVANLRVDPGQVITDINFGNRPIPAEIHGEKFKDLDADGVKDDGEPGLPGWTIYLDLDQSGTPTTGDLFTTTDEKGNYSFTDLDPFQTYTVAEVAQPGFAQTTPVPITGDVSATQLAAHERFQTLIDITTDGQGGFFLTGTDGGGSGFNSQEIFQVQASGEIRSLAAANSPTGIAADDQYVYWTERTADDTAAIARLSRETGVVDRLCPIDQSRPIGSPAGLAAVQEVARLTTLVTTDSATGGVFTMAATKPIDGVVQVGPPRYADSYDRQHASFVMVADGIVYLADPGVAGFGDTPPRIQSVSLSGGEWTDLYVGDPADFSPQGIAVHGDTIYVTSGSQILHMPTTGGMPTLVADDPRWGSLRGIEYHDGSLYVIDNGNGEGATVWKVDLQPAFSVNPNGGYVFSMSPGRVVTNADFGNRDPSSGGGASQTGRIQGRHFQDLNGNGVQDAGEVGLPGWTVYLDLNRNGTPDTTEPQTQTLADNLDTWDVDETGLYVFTNLADGQYNVDLINPQGWNRTTPKTAQLNQQDEKSSSTGEAPRAASVADFDRDGRLDLLIANDATNSVLRLSNTNTGWEQFGDPVSVKPGPVALAADQWNDDNGDGELNDLDYLDLAVASASTSFISLLMGTADGGFAEDSPLFFTAPAGGQFPTFSDVTAADLTGDGKPDLVVTDWSNARVLVLQNDGAGNFAIQAEYPTGDLPQAVAAADFNGDGRQDVAVANQQAGSVTILLYDATADGLVSAAPVLLGSKQQPVALAVGDLDGDGDLDLATANYLGNRVDVLNNDGRGVFTRGTSVVVASGPMSLAAADMNGDGLLDLLTSSSLAQQVTVLFNLGEGNFRNPTSSGVTNFAAGHSFKVAPADFDRDGDVDVAVAAGAVGQVLLMTNSLVPDAQHVIVGGASPSAQADFGSQLVNLQPTLDAIADPLPVPENAGEQMVSLIGISAGDGEDQPLSIIAISSKPGLIPHPTVTCAAGETTGSLAYTPAANQAGSAIVTVTVMDGGSDGDLTTTADNGSISRSFTVVVQPVNYTPTLNAIDNAPLTEDAGETVISLTGITAGSGESQPLSVDVASSKPSLISNMTVEYTSPADTGVLRFTPTANQSGTAVLTVTVHDGGRDGDLGTTNDNGAISRQFTVTVTAENDDPTLDAINDVTVDEDAASQMVPLSGITAGGGESQLLTVEAATDQPGLFSELSVLYTSPQDTGSVRFEPATDQNGSAVITLTLTDAGLDGVLQTLADNASIQRTFTITVNSVNDAPTLNAIANRQIDEDASTQTVSLAGISAGGGESQPLRVTASSDTLALIPTPTVQYSSSNNSGTVQFKPVVDNHGTAVISVTVTDGGSDDDLGTSEDNRDTTQAFTVTVAAVNDPPTISNITNQTTVEHVPVGPLSFAVSDKETAAESLIVTAVSDNPTLIPNENILLGGSGTQRTVSVAPADYHSGTVTVTVTVSDGDRTSSDAFVVNVTPAVALKVVSLAPMPSGFVAKFNHPLDTATLNLFDQGQLFGAADVTLVGTDTGEVRGSLVIDPDGRQVTFVKTGDLLEPDTYTVTLRSGVAAFRDDSGNLLDGKGDATPGVDYVGTFAVDARPSNQIVVSLPDVVRGPGQALNLPADDVTAGVPLVISDASNVSGIDLTIEYDPSLLEIENFTPNPELSARGAQAIFTNSEGVLLLTIASHQALSPATGPIPLGTITARVPDTAVYGAKHTVRIADLHVYDDSVNPTELPATGDDALHVVSYLGDTNGDGRYNAPDVTLLQRLIVGTNTGFAAFQMADPVLIADALPDGRIRATDTTAVLKSAAHQTVASVPPLPGGIVLSPGTPADPRIYIPKDLTAAYGGVVSVPIRLLVTEPDGITLSGFDVVIDFDPDRLTARIGGEQIGDLLAGSGFVGLLGSPASGRVIYTASSATGTDVMAQGTEGDLVTLVFDVASDAPLGPTVINLRTASGVVSTALFDNGSVELLLIPAPTDGATDAVDGQLTIISPWHNVDLPCDVDDNGIVAPLDALLTINYLNQHGSGRLPGRPFPLEPPYVDVDGNGILAPADVLTIINRINLDNQSSGEGEWADAMSMVEWNPGDILDDDLISVLAAGSRGG